VFGVGQSEGPEPCWLGNSDPDRSRCAEHGGVAKVLSVVCPTHGGSGHGRTTRGPAQRFKGIKRRPRQGDSKRARPKDIVKAGARKPRPSLTIYAAIYR